MNVNKKSQRAFAAVTLLTVSSVAIVLVVYAAVIGSMTGGEVMVGGSGSVTGTVYYSLANNPAGTWTTTLNPATADTSWYARLETSASGYAGPVTITWQLEQKTGTSSWAPVGSPVTTAVVLTTSSQIIYTSGLSEGTNQDWGAIVVDQGMYRVVVTVENA